MRQGRVVWITGASSGIGRCVAHACARRGDRLVISSRSAQVLEAVRAECLVAGAREVTVAPLDITDDAAVRAAVEAARAAFGRLDVVVQCAGVAAYGRVEDVPLDVFDAVIATNVLGAARVTRAAISAFRAQGSGTLVVVGSVLGRVSVPYMSAYITSKFALRGLVRTVQQEVQPLAGVDVVLVSPGGVDTPIYDQSATVMGRRNKPPFPVASPEAVAAAVLAGVERPRREIDVGWANPMMKAAFTLVPALFDRLAGPAIKTLGFGLGRRPNGTGNVLAPQAAMEGVHQRP